MFIIADVYLLTPEDEAFKFSFNFYTWTLIELAQIDA